MQESSVFNTDGRASWEHHALILQPRDGLDLERISGTFCHAVVDDQNSHLIPLSLQSMHQLHFRQIQLTLDLFWKQSSKYNQAHYKTQVIIIPECVNVSEALYKRILKKNKSSFRTWYRSGAVILPYISTQWLWGVVTLVTLIMQDNGGELIYMSTLAWVSILPPVLSYANFILKSCLMVTTPWSSLIWYSCNCVMKIVILTLGIVLWLVTPKPW